MVITKIGLSWVRLDCNPIFRVSWVGGLTRTQTERKNLTQPNTTLYDLDWIVRVDRVSRSFGHSYL